MKIFDIINENNGVKRVNTGIDMKAELAKRAAQISSPGTNPTLNTRTNVTRNSNSGTGASKKTFSKYISKMGDLGGTSLSKVNNFTSTKDGTTGTSTKRFVIPGGSGTQSVTDVGTGKTTNTKFQLKGPQSWAYDKPKTTNKLASLNASKKVKEDREDRTDVADRLADLANSQITGYFSSEDELHDFMYSELTSDEDYHDGGKTVDWAMGRVNDDVKGWLLREDGVIVPGVNTTVDVKPGQTEKEAAKFFGKGKPAELHKKARKNSNAHNLYNLGLTEDKKKEDIPKDDKAKDNKPNDIAGFDPQTAMAIKQLKAKYPHADNIMSALMAQTNQTLQNQYKGDQRRDEQDKKQAETDKEHSKKFLDMEMKLFNLIKKNNLKESKRQ